MHNVKLGQGCFCPRCPTTSYATDRRDEDFGPWADHIASQSHIIERLQDQAESMGHQWRELDARLQSTQKLLTDILFHLPSPPVKIEDGRVMEFVDPDPRRTLKLIQAALQRAVDASRGAVQPTGGM
jgi:hypothetical protein